MNGYPFLNVPDSCFIGNAIYKKMFYENGDFSSSDKALFTEGIRKVTWLYCLKPETINIPPYQDDVRDYPEVEVIEVEVTKDYKLNRVAEIIMKTIPYPMLLIFKREEQMRLFVAHQRVNQQDSSKNTIEECVSTAWLDSECALFAKLDIKQMRFTNFYALYCDMVDVISMYNVAHILPEGRTITGAQARTLSAEVQRIDQQMGALRAKIKSETQFNRKVDLQMEIKRLEQHKHHLTGGNPP